jgi:DNA-binding transcriptional LysR family regulator
VLCAAPSYIKAHGLPRQPSELARHNCLAHINLDYSDRIWRFRGPSSEISVKIEGDFHSNSALVLRKAVIAGKGIGFLPLYCTNDDLAAGRLQQILAKYPIPKRGFYALYPYKRMLPSRTRVFVNFLKDWFKELDKRERQQFAALR